MKKATFAVTWQMTGTSELEIPDEIADDKEAVREYVLLHWGDVPVPDAAEGSYVPDSDVLDDLSDIEVSDGEPEQLRLFDPDGEPSDAVVPDGEPGQPRLFDFGDPSTW